MRTPTKPGESALLTKKESKILNIFWAPLFSKSVYEEHSKNWSELVIGTGFEKVKTDIIELYKKKASLLRNFAKLTDKRLAEYKVLAPPGAAKRKKEITLKDVELTLLSRPDPVSKFIDEVLGLDPTGELFLKGFLAGCDTSNLDQELNWVEDVKVFIRAEVLKTGLYDELPFLVQRIGMGNLR